MNEAFMIHGHLSLGQEQRLYHRETELLTGELITWIELNSD